MYIPEGDPYKNGQNDLLKYDVARSEEAFPRMPTKSRQLAEPSGDLKRMNLPTMKSGSSGQMN